MFSRCLYFVMFATLLLTPARVDADDLATYREFRIGAATADVIARSGVAPRDVKTLHERPALLEELSWRPPYVVARAGDRDSVANITFSFVDGQLFRMAIAYDRTRTQGLTKDDLIASLEALYGPRSTVPAPAARRPAYENINAQTVVARWLQGDTTMTLQQATYDDAFGLVITSAPLDAIARKAQATAITMDAREAPARETARIRAAEDAAREAAEQSRLKNKATFRP